MTHVRSGLTWAVLTGAVLKNVFAGAAPIRGRQSGRQLVASRELARDSSLALPSSPVRSKTPPPVHRVLAPQTPESIAGSTHAATAVDEPPARTLSAPGKPLSTFERGKIEEYLEGQLSFGPPPTPLIVDRFDSELDSWLLGQAERSDPPPEPDDDIIAQLTPTPVIAPQPSSSALHTSQMTNIGGPCLLLRCVRA